MRYLQGKIKWCNSVRRSGLGSWKNKKTFFSHLSDLSKQKVQTPQLFLIPPSLAIPPSNFGNSPSPPALPFWQRSDPPQVELGGMKLWGQRHNGHIPGWPFLNPYLFLPIPQRSIFRTPFLILLILLILLCSYARIRFPWFWTGAGLHKLDSA